jgi:hypothetical protein
MRLVLQTGERVWVSMGLGYADIGVVVLVRVTHVEWTMFRCTKL